MVGRRVERIAWAASDEVLRNMKGRDVRKTDHLEWLDLEVGGFAERPTGE